jgi:hypothetical protein
VKTFEFDRDAELILVDAVVTGPRRPYRARLALDTGCSMTILIPQVIAKLGYREDDMVRRTVIRSPLGDERGYLLHVRRFTALGFSIADFPLDAHALPPGHGVDGLLGLSFLRHFNVELRFAEGIIRIDQPTATA